MNEVLYKKGSEERRFPEGFGETIGWERVDVGYTPPEVDERQPDEDKDLTLTDAIDFIAVSIHGDLTEQDSAEVDRLKNVLGMPTLAEAVNVVLHFYEQSDAVGLDEQDQAELDKVTERALGEIQVDELTADGAINPADIKEQTEAIRGTLTKDARLNQAERKIIFDSLAALDNLGAQTENNGDES